MVNWSVVLVIVGDDDDDDDEHLVNKIWMSKLARRIAVVMTA